MNAHRVLALALASAVLVVGAGCAGDDDAAAPSTTTTTAAPTSTTAPPDVEIPEFSGDPSSGFCQRVAGDELPVADPFEAGIEADEVALRLRALRVRIERLAEVAPPELDGDLSGLAERLDRLDQVLAEYDHDFAAAAEAGVDVSFTDDPELSESSARIDAYIDQVCSP